MAYRLPTFNVRINIWRFETPVTDPPASSPLANFNVGRRVSGSLDWEAAPGIAPFATSWLLCPMGTDLRGAILGLREGDTVEIPQASGLYYRCLWADRSALGFPNEHLAAIVAQMTLAPADALLDEDDDPLLDAAFGFLLQE